MSNTLKITVTQEDIDEAVRILTTQTGKWNSISECCPVSLAAKRITGRPVASCHAYVMTDPDTDRSVEYKGNKRLADWIREFDSTYREGTFVKPTSFTLKRNEGKSLHD